MTILTQTHTLTTCRCDFPSCATPAMTTPVETGAVAIWRAMGWYVSDDVPPLVYCPEHAVTERAAGKI